MPKVQKKIWNEESVDKNAVSTEKKPWNEK